MILFDICGQLGNRPYRT